MKGQNHGCTVVVGATNLSIRCGDRFETVFIYKDPLGNGINGQGAYDNDGTKRVNRMKFEVEEKQKRTPWSSTCSILSCQVKQRLTPKPVPFELRNAFCDGHHDGSLQDGGDGGYQLVD